AAVDPVGAHARWVEACHPAGTDVGVERNTRTERHAVEPNGDLARSGGGNGRGRVVDDEAGGNGEGNAEARMQEGGAPDIAFVGRVAEQKAVDTRKEGLAVAYSGPRCAERARVALGELDALRRIGVAGEEVEAGVGRAGDAAQVAVGGHRLQEARRGEGIVT